MIVSADRLRCCAVLIVVFAGLSAGCKGDKTAAAASTKDPGGRGDLAIPVTVAKAVQRTVPIQAEVIGSVEASETVSLKPQISGQVMQAYFKEGDFVTKGQLLLTIDPRTYEAQLNQLQAQILKDKAALIQAQANLERDKAQATNADAQLGRAKQLQQGGIISKEQFDQYVMTAASAAATINADQAAIENAKAQIEASTAAVENQKVLLGYTKIFAPISGRTGTLTVKPGNVVMANTTELATINRLQPVFVSFALPEVNLAALRQGSGKKLPVSAVPEEGGAPQVGVLAFYENAVDPTTGTIRLKATFPNDNKVLWPGQFVRVTLQLGEHPNAVLIPSQAVQSGQDGTFVYIVQPDRKVDMRKVVVSQRLGDESITDSGIAPGDTVVTEGTLRLVPGAQVQIRQPSGRPVAGTAPAGSGRGGSSHVGAPAGSASPASPGTAPANTRPAGAPQR